MDKRNCYSRAKYVPTSAEHIAKVRNNRETLLLARMSKGLSQQSNGTLRSFYIEKAKTNNWLEKVQEKVSRKLNTKPEEKIDVIWKTDEVTDVMKVQIRMRRKSLEVNQTEETRRRIREFLTSEIPGDKSRNAQLGRLDKIGAKNDWTELEQRSTGESSTDEKKTKMQASKRFRVRSRTSGICFSCSHCHLQGLRPSASIPNMTRKCSEEHRSHTPLNSNMARFRKLSVPMTSQLFRAQNRSYDVYTPHPPSAGNSLTSKGEHITRTGSCLKLVPMKKHSI